MTLFAWFIGVATFIVIISVLMLKYLDGDFDKKLTKEPEIPPDCELIDLGGRYMFKIGSHGFADMGIVRDWYIWYSPHHVSANCVSRSRSKTVRRGIKTYNLYKALGKI